MSNASPDSPIATRPYFTATTDSPAADFVAEANKHPVFALTKIDGQAAR